MLQLNQTPLARTRRGAAKTTDTIAKTSRHDHVACKSGVRQHSITGRGENALAGSFSYSGFSKGSLVGQESTPSMSKGFVNTEVP